MSQEWKNYLIFCINRLGQSIFSPQDVARKKFYMKLAADFSDDKNSRLTFQSAVSHVFETNEPCEPFIWKARYSPQDIKRYRVEIFPLSPDVAIVLLFRDELPAQSVTKKEIEILNMLVKGLSDQEISEMLEITQSTVRSHISNMMEKMNVESRILLGIEAYRLGLVHVI